MLDERDYPALFGTTQADWAPIDPTCAIRVPLTARTAGYRWWCPSGEWCGRAAFMLAASPPKSGGARSGVCRLRALVPAPGFRNPDVMLWPRSTRERDRRDSPAPASDRRCGHWDNAHWGSHIDRARREKLKASLRSLVVLVPLVLVENTFKVTPTPDQYPVQALLPYGSSYPQLGECVGVRRLDRR